MSVAQPGFSFTEYKAIILANVLPNLESVDMKKITSFVMAALTAVSATTAFAGGIEPVAVEPEPEPTVVAGPTSSSSGGLLVLLLLGVTLAAVAGSGTDGTNEETNGE